MASQIEIERKFLVVGDAWRSGGEATRIRQGYVANDGAVSVRIRQKGERFILTVKAGSEGIERTELEWEIPAADGSLLLDGVCTRPPIDKTRTVVEYGGRHWEIDEFAGANSGLLVAEVELESADAELALPDWVGPEVSSDGRFFNVYLYETPFEEWGVDYATLLADLTPSSRA